MRRRWFAGVMLFIALGMIVAGQTYLQGRLNGVAYAAYWIICLLLTLAAMITALLDLKALQRTTRDEHKDLLENTIKEIESQARRRPGRRGK